MGRMKDAYSYREAYEILQQAKSILRTLHQLDHIDLWDYGHPLCALTDACCYIDKQIRELQIEE